MDKLEALTALAEKVEAGDLSHDIGTAFINDNPDDHRCVQLAVYATRAAHGSLDAAKALHEAVLPEWGSWQVLMRTSWVDVVLTGPRTGYRGYQNLAATVRRDDGITCPARAWLLAIIRALIAQEESA